jgi:hypothetical protein
LLLGVFLFHVRLINIAVSIIVRQNLPELNVHLAKVGFSQGQVWFNQVSFKNDSLEMSCKFEVRGIDWGEAYFGKLKASEVCVSELRWVSEKKQKMGLDSLLKVLSLIEVDFLKIEASHIKTREFEAQSLQIQAYEVSQNSRYKFAQDFVMTCESFVLEQQKKANQIYFDTKKDSLFFGEIFFSNFYAKGLSVSNLDFEKAFKDKKLFCKKISCSRINYDIEGSLNSAPFELGYDSVWVGFISLDSVFVKSKKFELNNGKFSIQQFSTNKELTKQSPIEWIYEAEALVYEIKLNQSVSIFAHNLIFLGLKKGIKTQELSLSNFSSKQVGYDIKFQSTELANFDLRHFLRTKKIKAEKLKLNSPKATLWRNKNQDTTFLGIEEVEKIVLKSIKSLELKEIDVNNAELNVYVAKKDTTRILGLKGLYLNGKGFEIYKGIHKLNTKIFFFEDVGFSLNNFFSRNRDSVHLFELKKLSYSNQQINLTGLGFYPVSFNPHIKRYDIRIPSLSLTGFEIKKFINNQDFYADSLLIEIADVDFLNQNADTKVRFPKIDSIYQKMVLQADSIEKSLFYYLKSFHISQVQLKKIKFNHISDDSDTASVLVMPEVDLNFEGFELDSAKLAQKKLQFTVKSGLMKVKNFNYRNQQSLVLAEQITVFPKDSALELTNLKLSNQVKNFALVKKIYLNGVDYPTFFADTSLNIKKCEIENAILDWYFEKNSLPSQYSGLIKSVDLDELRLKNCKLYLNWDSLGLYARRLDVFGKKLRKNSLGLGYESLRAKAGDWSLVGHELKSGGDSLVFDTKLKFVKLYKPYLVSKELSFYSHKFFLEQISFDSLLERRFRAKNLSVLNPEIELNIQNKNPQIKLNNFYSYLPMGLKGFDLGKILLREGKLTWQDTIKHSLKRFNFELLDLKIAENSSKRLLDSKEFRFWGSEYEIEFPKISSTLKLKNWLFRSHDSTLKIQSASLEPEFESEVFPFLSNSDNRVEIKAQNIALRKLRVQKWLDEGHLSAHRFEVGEFQTTVYSDEIQRKSYHYKPLLQEMILNARPKFKIDTFLVKKGKIRYERMCFLTDSVGFVEISDIRIESNHIGNIEKGSVSLTATGFLLGESFMELTLVMDLKDSTHKHYVGGKISLIAPELFNTILTPALSFKIKDKAACRQINFDFTADQSHSFGHLTAVYRKLHIQRIDPIKNKVRISDAMFNLMANSILKNRNPRFLFVEQGKIYFLRDTSRSFVSFWVRSALEGIKTTVGLPPKFKPPRSLKVIFREIRENRMRRSELKSRSRKW